jgi:hypothetical protein
MFVLKILKVCNVAEVQCAAALCAATLPPTAAHRRRWEFLS